MENNYNGKIIFKWINKKDIYSKYNNKGKPLYVQSQINKAHIHYIATRSGVDLGHDVHGLFGHILDTDDVECLDLDVIENYTKDISKKGIDVFKTVISIENEDAIGKGIISKEKWKELLEERMPEISKAFKIPFYDMEYVASFHAKKNKPHCHFVMWNKNQELSVKRKPFISYKKVRSSIAKSVYGKELDELYSMKDESKSKVGDLSYKEINNINAELKEILPAEFNIPPIAVKINENNINKVSERLRELEKVSNSYKKGFIYKYQTPETKKTLDEISKIICESNQDCKMEFEKYVDTCIKINKILQKINSTTDYEKTKKVATYEVMKKIGNQVLKSIKEMKTEEYKAKCKEWKEKRAYWNQRYKEYQEVQGEFEARHELYDKQLQEIAIRNLIQDTYKLLAQENISKNQYHNRATKAFGDLSKRAIKEIAKNSKSSGFDWYHEI